MESGTIDPGDVRFFSGNANPKLAADIASYLGLASETVSRILSRLQRQGLIRLQRKRARLLEPESLQTLAR